VNDQGEARPLQVKEGDRVLFGKYSGSEIKINGEELLILAEDKILAIIEG
jgi:chaperonin GroES